MRIKATRVAYAFSVQYFENATVVAYAGLRVKGRCGVHKHMRIKMFKIRASLGCRQMASAY